MLKKIDFGKEQSYLLAEKPYLIFDRMNVPVFKDKAIINLDHPLSDGAIMFYIEDGG